MKGLGTRSFRIAVLMGATVCTVVLLFWLRANFQGDKTIPKRSDYSVGLQTKEWDTTITGQYTVAGIDSREQLPILILDLAVANRSEKEFLLNCALLQANDNLKTIQDVYFPFWALNIKREEDLRLARIPAKAARRGKIAFQLARTEQELWLDCGSDVRVRVQ